VLINYIAIAFAKCRCLNSFMQKLACVFSFRESDWVSCQKIVFNLHEAYEGIQDTEIRNFDYGRETTVTQLSYLVENIQEYKPDTIVILDHKPHPFPLFKFLLAKFHGKQKPRIIFHVFGDFTIYYRDWHELGLLLKDFQVEFVVASDRQKLLIDKFLQQPHSSKVCPFPVKPENFFFLPEERNKQRLDWGVKEDEVVFTFTGRISRQKRTHLLLKCFDEALRRENTKNAHLFIYGLADHIGDNFLGIWENENEYFRKIHRLYMELPESSRSRIHFMGNVPNAELRSVYAGADYLLNLSVHNDEDFGMSVAEAQMTGLPAILSDWGGLSSFEHPRLPEATTFIRVSLGVKSKIISKKEVTEALVNAIRVPLKINREKLIALSREKFSVTSATQKLTQLLEETSPLFTSFSEFHSLIARRLEFHMRVYVTKDLKIHPIYRKIYSAYVRNP
jgi:glycosyltransferase involved in cell wall biosynthesis